MLEDDDELAVPAVEPVVEEALVEEVVAAELVDLAIGNDLPPIVTFVAGALPKFSVTDVALAFSLTVRTLPEVTVP